MTIEKRGNSETEVKMVNGKLLMVLPGSTVSIPYDGRFDGDGLQKIASLKEGNSTFFEEE